MRLFAIALLAAALSLEAGAGQSTSHAARLRGANRESSQPLHSPLPMIHHYGAAGQENRAGGSATDTEGIRWADHFPGNDLGAQINAADSNLGKEAGEIWVGRQGTVATKVTISSNHSLRLVVPTTWKAGMVVQNNNTISANGCAALITVAFTPPGPLILGKGTSSLKLQNLCAEAAPKSVGYGLVEAWGRGVEVTGCILTNVRLGDFNSSMDVKLIGNTAISDRNDPPSGQGVNFTFTQNAVASGNIIRGFEHGLQWWGGDPNPDKGQGGVANARGARNLTYTGNTVTDVGGGGIWGGMGEGIVVSGNVVERCGDVCLDSEGSNSVVFSNNYVMDGTNGAIATFYYNRDVLVTGNTVVSSSAAKPLLRTYTNWQKAPYDRDEQVVGNHFTCLDTSPCFINSTTGLPERFVFKDNTLRNVTVDVSDTNPKHILVISGNDFLFDAVASKVPGAIRAARTYSLAPGTPGSCDISNNTVRSDVPQPPGSAAIMVYQDDPQIAPLTTIQGNRLLGLHPFPVDIAVGGGSSNPAVTPVFVVRDNLMGAGVFSRLDQARPRSTVKLEGNYRMDSSPLPGQ